MAENSDNQSSISSSSPSNIPNPENTNTNTDTNNINNEYNNLKHQNPQIPGMPNFPALQHGDINMLPIMYPALVPGLITAQNPEQMNGGPGIYAVPVLPFMGTVTGIPTNTLIPLRYRTPTTTAATSEAGPGGAEQGQVGQQQQPAQQIPPQRQVIVRRFQIAFQLDLMLIVKLAAVIFIFNQDGSRQRLALLVVFAIIVYLYQTGTLTPLIRWASQAMQRAAAPPRPPRPAARVEPIARQGNENAAIAADGQPGGDDEILAAANAEQVAENEILPEAVAEGGNQWWGIVKEIQMIVFGFITSLLPGFHNLDHA